MGRRKSGTWNWRMTKFGTLETWAGPGRASMKVGFAADGAPLDPYIGWLESLLVSPLSGVKVTSRVGACFFDLRCCEPVVPVGAVVPVGVVVVVVPFGWLGCPLVVVPLLPPPPPPLPLPLVPLPPLELPPPPVLPPP